MSNSFPCRCPQLSLRRVRRHYIQSLGIIKCLVVGQGPYMDDLIIICMYSTLILFVQTEGKVFYGVVLSPPYISQTLPNFAPNKSYKWDWISERCCAKNNSGLCVKAKTDRFFFLNIWIGPVITRFVVEQPGLRISGHISAVLLYYNYILTPTLNS